MPGDAIFVVPAYNAQETIMLCLQSIALQLPAGVIVVDDGSTDATAAIVRRRFSDVHLLVNPLNRGAAASLNTAIRFVRSHYQGADIAVVVDSDAVLSPRWWRIIEPYAMTEHRVAAVAGLSLAANSSMLGRIMGRDVERRLKRLTFTDQLYTMNTAYRLSAVEEVGMFNESLREAYDVELSRKLIAAGYRLRMVPQATCYHYWRDSWSGYIRQQYRYAYWRLAAGGKGDAINGWTRLAQAVFPPLALAASLPQAFEMLLDYDWAGLAVPVVHTARASAWAAGCLGYVWGKHVHPLSRPAAGQRGKAST